MGFRRGRQTQEIHHRGVDVDGAHLVVDDFSARELRAGDNQRDVEGCIIKENAVCRLPVLAQALTVIAHGDDQRAGGKRQLVDAIEQPPHLLVHVRNLAVIRTFRILVFIGLGRVVGRMRIVVVCPDEKLSLGILLQPVERAVRHDAGASLRQVAGKESILRLGAHVVVVSIKPLGDAKVFRQHS